VGTDAQGRAPLRDQRQEEVRGLKILQYLKDHGERLDSDLAKETGCSLESICLCLSELSDRGDVVMCRTTRFTNGKKIEGMLYRASGYSPHASPGRKPTTPKGAEKD
jgi:transcription initiation factor IIE alpha subunit